ncbi:MAG: iron dicitrate transport regulator FecR [Deltaproteobacteria bacterium]|nr:iron dicitrate transport regulator FecR [Deltaproteobacteria bacterium]
MKNLSYGSEMGMKTWVKGFGWMVIVAVVLLGTAHAEEGSLGSMRLKLVQGDVQVKIADTGEWAPASVNMPLVEGDELWVPDGSLAAVQTNNGAYIRLGAGTAMQILRMDSNSFQFYLAQGRAYARNNAYRRNLLQFDTPDASIRDFANSTFRIDIPNGETDVAVFHGSVVAENESGKTNLRPGDMLVLFQDGYAELSPLPPPDDWQEWNAEQDRIVLARGTSYGHLPEELRVYSSDLDGNGRWVYVQNYGYCWTPTVVVTGDWAPYRHGRWVWRGGDYIWIGYEPWGWVPYHYGRWAFVAGIGWCWVPPARGDVYWAPGYVGWVRTGDYVAWVPLAPREIYYGYGNYGRYSRNVRNVDVNRIRVTNVYRNINVTNSITVVNQTTFVTGRHAPVHQDVVRNIRQDFSQRRGIVIGRPQIKPVETSRIPVVRSIPDAKRPPASVRKIDVKELKQSRPLVKEQGRSAIRPGAPARALEVKKVEKPTPVNERARERRQIQPGERRLQGAPRQETQPQNGDRGGKPVPAAPERKVTPVERERPKAAPAERGKPQAAPVERERPKAAPAERGKPQAAPVERERQKETPAEKGKPKASPAEKEKPKEAPDDDNGRDQRRGGPEREFERGRR